MEKPLIILSILFFAFLMAIPFNTTKAIDNINKATTSAKFENRIFTNYKHQIFKHKPAYFYYPYLNHAKDKNGIEIFKDIIEFVKNIFLVIFFVIWAFISILRLILNSIVKNKYKADNNKYEIKRDENEGKESERHSIYLVEKDSDGKKVYHHVNTYTYEKLGYPRPPRDKDCFNSKDGNHIMGKGVIIYSIIEILKLTNVTL